MNAEPNPEKLSASRVSTRYSPVRRGKGWTNVMMSSIRPPAGSERVTGYRDRDQERQGHRPEQHRYREQQAAREESSEHPCLPRTVSGLGHECNPGSRERRRRGSPRASTAFAWTRCLLADSRLLDRLTVPVRSIRADPHDAGHVVSGGPCGLAVYEVE